MGQGQCNHRWRLGAKCCLPNGHEGEHLYKCSHPECPGLPYPASEKPHRHEAEWSEEDEPRAGKAEYADSPSRVEWPAWLGPERAAALRNLEQTAELAAHSSQPARVRAAGRQVRYDLATLRHSVVAPTASPPWPASISPGATEALEAIESQAALGAVETFSAPRPWGTVQAAMRQLRQNLVELTSALEAAQITDEMLEAS